MQLNSAIFFFLYIYVDLNYFYVMNHDNLFFISVLLSYVFKKSNFKRKQTNNSF